MDAMEIERGRPEWLPFPGEPISSAAAELIGSHDRTELGKLCTGIAHELRKRHEGVRIHRFDAATIQANWSPESEMFYLAHVTVVNWANAYVVRYVQIRCDKTYGWLRVRDRSGLLERG